MTFFVVLAGTQDCFSPMHSLPHRGICLEITVGWEDSFWHEESLRIWGKRNLRRLHRRCKGEHIHWRREGSLLRVIAFDAFIWLYPYKYFIILPKDSYQTYRATTSQSFLYFFFYTTLARNSLLSDLSRPWISYRVCLSKFLKKSYKIYVFFTKIIN